MNSDKIIWEGSPFPDNKEKYCLILSKGELVCKAFAPGMTRSNPFTGQKITYKADWILVDDLECQNTILEAALLHLLNEVDMSNNDRDIDIDDGT